jgi:hypothetical protein
VATALVPMRARKVQGKPRSLCLTPQTREDFPGKIAQ